ncbi:MAG TPA: AraC family transcriptional regulator [Ktedonobacteraceae bacterium]|nr:AraC family transcriptional regulator [Ktedonobacteraceae bacterium]
MTDQFAVPKQISKNDAASDELSSPILMLSSREAESEGLIARAYNEPTNIEGMVIPAIPAITLVLITRGSLHLEQREAGGPWEGCYAHVGDLFLTPGGAGPRELRWRSLSGTSLHTLQLHLSTELVSRAVEQVIDGNPTRLRVEKRSAFQDALLTQMGFALWRELEHHPSVGQLYVEMAAQLLAVHLLCHYTSTGAQVKQEHQPGLTHQQVRRVTDFIQAHLNQHLPLERLAEQIGFSVYHFARLFRQTIGESPHQFVLRQRIEQARLLLKETDLPLAQIALQVGFPNQSHFTVVFKEHLGLSPRAYRQERE